MPPAQSQTATSTPRLSEFARSFVYPTGIVRTVWTRVEARGHELGLGFDWWQSQLGTVILGYRENGKYAATVGGVGMSIPRQVGKTYFVLAMLFILCILFPGLQVVWTSHHLRTTTKTMTTARGFSRRKKLAPHVRAVRTSHGEGQVEFVNGSLIMFGARSQGFGRGFDEIDVEVFDEAQILDMKALEDMVAAANQARHEHGALLLYMGTPPRPTDPSDAFRLRRSEALSGDSEDAVWLEIGADPESAPDDRSQWPRMNPSFPTRTPEESLLRLRKNLGDDDSWNREGRGIWDPTSAKLWVIPETFWTDAENVPTEPRASLVTLAVDASPKGDSASVAACALRADGGWQIELLYQAAGVAWLPAYLKGEIATGRVSGVVMDKAASALVALIDDFKAHDVRVTWCDWPDVRAACAGLMTGVVDGSVHHAGQRQLTTALSQAGKRDAEGGWAWSRRTSNSDITPVVAVTLALWGARNSKTKKATTTRREGGRQYVTRTTIGRERP